MAALVLFLTVIAAAQACPPTTTSSSSSSPSGRKPRAAEVVRVTVVTNQKYDPSRNDAHMETMKALLNDYTQSQKVVYDRSMVRERARNVGGKFAVLYIVQNADCGQVSNFARGARRQAKFITKMGMRCGGRPEVPIN